ncbi:MAG: ATP-binding protein [Propionibacteriaceae bacterium]
MAAKELGPASLRVARAVAVALADSPGPCVVGVSGGADSLALAAGVAWAARRQSLDPLVVVVDHQLQPGSAEVAEQAAAQCRGLGLATQIVAVKVGSEGGMEAAARDARRQALAAAGAGPILLGHTSDDQAESVLLGLARGSGGRSLAGMRPVAGRYRRSLLGLR